MTELDVTCGFEWLANWLDKHVSPRQYYLHNRAGGRGWEFYKGRSTKGHVTRLKIEDPKIATFVMLSVPRQ